MPVETITLSHVKAGRKELKLVKPLEVTVRKKYGWWWMEHLPLNIIATHPKREDCIDDVQAMFMFVYESYGLEDDSRLSKRAQELKRTVLAFVKKSV